MGTVRRRWPPQPPPPREPLGGAAPSRPTRRRFPVPRRRGNALPGHACSSHTQPPSTQRKPSPLLAGLSLPRASTGLQADPCPLPSRRGSPDSGAPCDNRRGRAGAASDTAPPRPSDHPSEPRWRKPRALSLIIINIIILDDFLAEMAAGPPCGRGSENRELGGGPGQVAARGGLPSTTLPSGFRNHSEREAISGQNPRSTTRALPRKPEAEGKISK